MFFCSAPKHKEDMVLLQRKSLRTSARHHRPARNPCFRSPCLPPIPADSVASGGNPPLPTAWRGHPMLMRRPPAQARAESAAAPQPAVAVAVEAGHNPVAHRREQRPPRRRRRRRPRRAGAWLPSPPKSATGLISPPQDLTTLRAPFCAIWRWSLMPLGAGAKQPLAGAPPARVARRGGREWRRAPNAALVGKAHAAGVRRETHASAAAAPVGPVQRLGPVQHNTPDRPKW
eukprot:gene13258-biopygen2267